MDRKELYSKINEIGGNIKNAIKEHYGDNYTRIPSDKLEEFINDWIATTSKTENSEMNDIKPEDLKDVVKLEKPTFNENIASNFIKLIATLQVKRILTKEEAEEILG